MQLSTITEITQNRDFTNVFSGINHTDETAQGEWYDLLNMSTDRYPVASVRNKRGKVFLGNRIKHEPLTSINYEGTMTMPAYVDQDGISTKKLQEFREEHDIGSYSSGAKYMFLYQSMVGEEYSTFKVGDVTASQIRSWYDSSFETLPTPSGGWIDIGLTTQSIGINTVKLISVTQGYDHRKGVIFQCANCNYKTMDIVSYRDARSGEEGIICVDALSNVFLDNMYAARLWTDTLSVPVLGAFIFGSYLIVKRGADYIDDLGYFNLSNDLDDSVNLEFGTVNTEYSYTVSNADAYMTAQLCKSDGTAYSNVTVSSTAPSNPANGKLWIDTSAENHVLKQYSSTNSMWTTIATTYIRISLPQIARGLHDGYDFEITDLSGVASTVLTELKGKHILAQKVHYGYGTDPTDPYDHIVVTGIIDQTHAFTNGQKFAWKKKIPIMDHLFSANNRLWGCRSGLCRETAAPASIVNEIYASKQGDFRNWYTYLGVSTDSWTASCGTEGEWTGACAFNNYPTFFKENCIYKVYGSYPAQYQFDITETLGVAKGASESIAVSDNVMMYQSKKGACVYDGSYPSLISDKLGDLAIMKPGTKSVGSIRNRRYIINYTPESESSDRLFSYDMDKGIWTCEEGINSWYKKFHPSYRSIESYSAMSHLGDLIWKVDTVSSNNVASKSFLSYAGIVSNTQDEQISWFMESAPLYTDMPDQKYISKILVRLSMDIGSRASFFVQYDGFGDFKHLSTVSGTSLRTFTLPIRPKRCDTLKLRIEGTGNINLYSITKTIETGSDYTR